MYTYSNYTYTRLVLTTLKNYLFRAPDYRIALFCKWYNVMNDTFLRSVA